MKKQTWLITAATLIWGTSLTRLQNRFTNTDLELLLNTEFEFGTKLMPSKHLTYVIHYSLGSVCLLKVAPILLSSDSWGILYHILNMSYITPQVLFA